MMCGIAYAQPGVDSTQTLPNPTPMTAKEYKFKYIQALNTISARSKFFGYDSAFFKNGIYTDITPPADDSSDLVPNTDWVMRQLAAYTPGGGGAEDTLILGRGIARDSLAPTKNRIYLDSAIYIVTQINDSTLSFTHYDGRIDTVSMAGSGGGGGTGWGLSGNAITTGDFLGTTNGQKLMFKVNNAQSGLIDYSGNNVSLGYQSFLNNTSGSSNNAIGSLSLQSNTSGAFNNAMGHFSLYTNTSGALNTAIGNGAMYFNTTGSSNNAVGYQSLYANTTGIENNGFGVNSIRNNTTGQMNTAMGDSSLVTLTTGSRNTAIGANADVATSSTDSAVAIGYQAVAATKQIAFSPHVTQIKATGITGASNSGYVLTTNGSGIATFQAAGGGSPAGNYGNIQINRNSIFSTPASDSLTFSSATLAVKGALTTTGAITASGNVAGNLGLFTSGVRTGNNTNFYWNSGPVILGNTNDITLKNAAATAGANVSIGTSAAVASAILDVNSTAKGALLPRMTGTEAEAISSPATGLIIYCTNGNGSVITSVGLWNYNGSAWVTAGAKPYQILTGNLTQTGTGAPTFTILQNTTGVTYTTAYTGVGLYTLTANSGTPFTANKTQVYIGGNVATLGGDFYSMNTSINSTTVIGISSGSYGIGFNDDILSNTPIEIRIYP